MERELKINKLTHKKLIEHEFSVLADAVVRKYHKKIFYDDPLVIAGCCIIYVLETWLMLLL